MLSSAGDDVISFPGIHVKYAFDGQVVPFGSTGCENDFLGRLQQLCHLFPGIINSFLSLPSEGMVSAGRITKILGKIGES